MTTNKILITVIEALAQVEGVSPLDLEFTLADYVDPEFLEWIGQTGSAAYHVTFPVPGHEVRVHGNGNIFVDDNPSPTTFDIELEQRRSPSGTRTEDTTKWVINPLEGKPHPSSRTVELCFLFDKEGTYRDIITKADNENLLYTDASGLLNQSVAEVLPEPTGSVIHENIQRTFESEKPVSFEYQLPINDRNRNFSAETTLIESTVHGQIVMLAVTEITEQLHVNDPLRN